ncbi:hypothetical protein Pan216_06090 [Planctomycetes bacterium Pan216]|uniref:Uncharacterized protein n=1 Tax=Kolteria novifilia TaxID=2527975 RepID=A0A518AYH3_9BACT|nr:hypothetical protein Pan216_06090 [Planctomycetes bacterium Pan216]
MPRDVVRTLVAGSGLLSLVLFAGISLGQEAPNANPPADANKGPKGRMITIRGSIDSGLKNRVINATRTAVREGAEIIVFDIQAGKSDFGASLDLANAISELGGKVRRTVAFVSKPVTGHGALVALACDEIVMAPDAKLGDVFGDLPVDARPIEEKAYADFGRLKGHGTWIPLGMVNKDIRLVEVKTPQGKRFMPSDKLDEFKKGVQVLDSTVIKEAGQRLLLDADQARSYGLARGTAGSRKEVATMYGLPESTAAEDILYVEAVRPILVKLEGAFTGRLHQYLLRRLKQASSEGSDLLFVQIDSTSGEVAAADGIAHALKSWPGRTVAWVPKQAIGVATYTIFGCDELIIAPDAEIGGFEISKASKEEYQALADSAVDMSKGGKYPEAFVRGFVDPNVSVFEVRNKANPNLISYKTAGELENPVVANEWDKARRGPLKEAGISLTMNGKTALSVDVAAGEASTRDELKSLFDISGTIPTLQPGWVDALVDGLTSVGGTVLLLFIGLTCLYIEFQMPGFGIGGLVATICFVLFFWSRFLSNQAGSLEVTMFLLGLILIAVELFVIPGFGITGFAGILLLFGSLLLASQSFIAPSNDEESWEMLTNLSIILGVIFLFAGAAVASARYLPAFPYLRHMVLAPPEQVEENDAEASYYGEEESGAASQYDHLLNQTGVAMSTLRPAGRMELDNEYFDVVAQGEFVDAGTPVKVVEVYQNRIVVRPSNGA